MKIGIVTWFHYINYGTALQAYALQKFLKSNGYSCVLVNYVPQKKAFIEKIMSGNYIKRVASKIESYRFKLLKHDIKEEIDERKALFKDFLNKNIDFTPKIQSNEDLYRLNDIIDCFICGSDQIWNPENLNGVYFLDFADEKKKKISYAPSFGVRSISASKKRKVQKWINRIDKLSVREEEGARILNTITQKNVEVVVDPTLLLSSFDWEKCMINPDIKEKYILCYFLGDKREYWDVARSFANKTKYKVVVIPVRYSSFLKNYDIRISVGPEEFIGLIKNAELVLTDSYHGTIFSILFEKDFYVFKRFNDFRKDSQNSRVYSILKMCNLEERLIGNNFFVNCKHDISIDKYERVFEVLNDKIKASKSFLLKNLYECEGKKI